MMHASGLKVMIPSKLLSVMPRYISSDLVSSRSCHLCLVTRLKLDDYVVGVNGFKDECVGPFVEGVDDVLEVASPESIRMPASGSVCWSLSWTIRPSTSVDVRR